MLTPMLHQMVGFAGFTTNAMVTWVGYDNPYEAGNYLTLEQTVYLQPNLCQTYDLAYGLAKQVRRTMCQAA